MREVIMFLCTVYFGAFFGYFTGFFAYIYIGLPTVYLASGAIGRLCGKSAVYRSGQLIAIVAGAVLASAVWVPSIGDLPRVAFEVAGAVSGGFFSGFFFRFARRAIL